jgi:hypothetical protein
MTRNTILSAALVFGFSSVCADVYAQPAQDRTAVGDPQTTAFDQVARELTVGDRLTVIDRDGRPNSGALVWASARGLRVTIDGQPRDYEIANVQAVYKQTSRATRGALIGLGIGAAFGVFWAERVSASAGRYVGGTFLFGGMGAAAGAAIGAAFSRQREIYRARSGIAATLDPSTLQVQPNLAKPRPDQKWAVSAVVGTTSSGPAGDLEDAMRAAGFDENRGSCIFGLCFPGANHPFSRTGFGEIGFPWTISAHRWLSSWYGVGVSGGFAGIGTTMGQRRDSGEYLDVQYSVATVAPLFMLRPAHGLHTGIGPAFFTTTFTTGPTAANQYQTQTKRTGGLLWEAGVTVPPRSRVFGEFLVQYRHVGRVSAGPFDATNGFSTSTLPGTNVQMNHWFLGVGAGLRF